MADPRSNTLKKNPGKARETVEKTRHSKTSDVTEKFVKDTISIATNHNPLLMEKTPVTTSDSSNYKKSDTKEKSYEEVQPMADINRVEQSQQTVETEFSEMKPIPKQQTQIAANTAEEEIKVMSCNDVKSAEDTASILIPETGISAKNEVKEKACENAESIAPATENNDSEISVGASRPTETAEPKEHGGADKDAAVEDKVELIGSSLRVSSQPEIDPSVAHIIDFSSDAYAPDYKEKKDTIHIPHYEKFKKYVFLPDPRPLIGCIWCGRGNHRAGITAQITGKTCPACQYFADIGWERVHLVSASKTIFKRPDGETMNSIREFLQESSKILCPKLGGMNVDETLQPAKPAKATKKVIERRLKKRGRLDRSIILPIGVSGARKRKQIERYTDSHTNSNTSQQVEDEKKLQLSSKKQKREIAKSANGPVASGKADTTPSGIISWRKQYVCSGDPRPIPGECIPFVFLAT